ncbi:MAG: hypothetical protein PHU25_04555 [Deltaproteobacteria bacterium]|nr:hypothetical protein [Deltaproteobacteria bacterium]
MTKAGRKMARSKAKKMASGQADVSALPFGPAYLSAGWNDEDADVELVSVIVTRRLPDGRFLVGLALVDRTCLGVKDAYDLPPLGRDGLRDAVERVGLPHDGMEEVEPLVALSVVHHALAYARKLGFEPHPDFPAAIFGPRPEALVDTPHANDEKPLYVAGPHDDSAAVTRKLDAAVGNGNYDFIVPLGGIPDDFDEEDGESS